MKCHTTIVSVAAVASVAWAIVPPRQPHQPVGNGNLLLTYNNTVVRNEFGAGLRSVQWLATGEDGQYISMVGNALVLNNIVTNEVETFVAADKIPADLVEYWIRPDLKKILFATNYTKQYRYSYFGDYSVLDVESGVITPIVADQAGDIQFAALSPVNDDVAFVRGNNLYLNKNGTIVQITSDGGPDKFNGVPDWVYEEEIFSDRSTLWFSPDGRFIAFLSFDETGVGTFTVPYYMAGQTVAPPYPVELDLRYPKVGTTNPTVALSLLNVETEEITAVAVDAFPAEDLIIGDVSWVTSGHKNLLYRAFNRVQDHETVVVVEVDSVTSNTVRERDGSDGWLDNNRAIAYVGTLPGACNTSHYLDLSDESGWNHIYLFPVQGGEGVALTSGDWEVTAILKIDTGRQLIYYQSTEHHSTERHLYSVSYVTGEKKALVDDTVSAYWTASFSASGSYYILSYQGPDVPYQELYSINSTEPLKVITSNEAAWNKLQLYKLPNITYFELEHPEGFSLNVMQRLPANFDPSKKYPAIFLPYGGPGSQEVTKRFQSLSWRAYIASDPELEYVTYTVDNRGTGLKGRAFRSTVASQLGLLEAEDQIWAAQELISEFPFVDAAKVAIWGWSYGGYLSAKVLEANSGVFSTALITAPVSDWRFYDSMYTERYMKTYEMNSAGYDKTAVRNAEGFMNAAGGFTIMHGLGDDNVHYQNTAALVDLLVGAGVPPSKMNWLAFTDSDHGISYNGATKFLYKYLTEAIFREKVREPETLTHQWTRRSETKATFHFE